MDKSYIECRRFTDFRNNVERVEYEWYGKNPTIRISHDTGLFPGKSIGDIFSIGPYKLSIIEFDYNIGVATCIRVDYPFWWWFVFAHHAGRTFDLFYRRLILTAAVWKLADYNPGIIPGWQDLHFVKWLARTIKRYVDVMEKQHG